MSTSEAGFRTEISRALIGAGAFVRTITQRFASGMPDLLVCQHGQAWLLELKFVVRRKTDPAPPPIRLTQLQRFWIRSFQKHGGKAGWVVGVKVQAREWRAYAGINPDQAAARPVDLVMVRHVGEGWDATRLLDHLEFLERARGGRKPSAHPKESTNERID